MPELDRQRLVVAEQRGELGVALGADAALAGHQRDGVAGQEADEGKGDDRHADEGRHEDAEARYDEAEHG